VTRLTGHTDSHTCGKYEEVYPVCATDFAEYMGANLLSPFGMTSSGYFWPDASGESLARPHDKNGTLLKSDKPTVTDVARYGSAGALLSTPTDYAKFLIEVMDPKPVDAFRLGRDSLKEMLRPHVDVPGYPVRSSWRSGGRSCMSTAET
jgi:CubicO group peptidase (beta-lactamase class C family)